MFNSILLFATLFWPSDIFAKITSEDVGLTMSLTQSTNFYNLNDEENNASGTFSLAPTLRFNKRQGLGGRFSFSKNYQGDRELLINDSTVIYSYAFSDSPTFNHSASLALQIPFSKQSRRSAGLYMATGLSYLMGVSLKPLAGISTNFNIVSSIHKQFHEFENSRSGAELNDYSASTLVRISLGVKEWTLSLNGYYIFIKGYRSDLSEIVRFSQALSYAPKNSSWSVSLEHEQMGNAQGPQQNNFNSFLLSRQKSNINLTITKSF